jgi:ankyrin repeat protein
LIFTPSTGQAASLEVAFQADDASLNARCANGGTALHYAAAAGYAELCQELLEMPNFFGVNDQDSQAGKHRKKRRNIGILNGIKLSGHFYSYN